MAYLATAPGGSAPPRPDPDRAKKAPAGWLVSCLVPRPAPNHGDASPMALGCPSAVGLVAKTSRNTGTRSETLQKEGPTGAIALSYLGRSRILRYQGPEYRPNQCLLAQHVGICRVSITLQVVAAATSRGGRHPFAGKAGRRPRRKGRTGRSSNGSRPPAASPRRAAWHR
jgi:hypothetical protein